MYVIYAYIGVASGAYMECLGFLFGSLFSNMFQPFGRLCGSAFLGGGRGSQLVCGLSAEKRFGRSCCIDQRTGHVTVSTGCDVSTGSLAWSL